MIEQLNPLVKEILASRGIGADAAEEFLSARPQLTHDPFLLTDMRAGVDLLLKEIDAGSRIVVYGDYDADGVTATALLLSALGELTDNLSYYIPSRIDEGYGLHVDAIDRIHADGGEVIVTVDCGAVSRKETDYAHALGIRTVVTDHHNVGEVMASGIVIDPKRPDDRYPFKGLAGVGVAFKLVQAIAKERPIPRSLINSLLELVAIGTVADVMPLLDENRTLVKYGLRNMHLGCYHKSLARLIELSGYKAEELKARGISFGIAPRINSAGRIGDASLGVRLLLATDPAEIETCCTELLQLNQQRRSYMDQAYTTCRALAEEESRSGDFLVLETEGLHEGVLGIVAGKIKEEFNRPCVIISRNGGESKGTGRSVTMVSLFDMLDRHRDEFIRFGGHSAACGFTILSEKIPALKKALNEELNVLTKGDPDFFEEPVRYDAVIAADRIDLGLIEQLELLEPCGQGNEQPVFAVPNVRIDDWRYLKSGEELARFRAGGLDCVRFGGAYEYYDHYMNGEPVVVTGTLEKNNWNGRCTPQMRVNGVYLPEEVHF